MTGEISEEENETLNTWMLLSYENKELFDLLKLIWDNSEPNYSEDDLPYDPDEELQNLSKE